MRACCDNHCSFTDIIVWNFLHNLIFKHVIRDDVVLLFSIVDKALVEIPKGPKFQAPLTPFPNVPPGRQSHSVPKQPLIIGIRLLFKHLLAMLFPQLIIVLIVVNFNFFFIPPLFYFEITLLLLFLMAYVFDVGHRVAKY